MSLKARVEAVLFLTDKPLAAAAIAQLVNVDVQEVRQSILELIHDYEERNSALEIADDNGYMMQVKDEFATFANDMAPIDLPVSVVRTLSAIAIKQPVLQSEIVRIRGAGAYDHIKELLEKELITKKEEGRSALLGTTKKFQEYFRLSQDAKLLRDQLKEQAKTKPPTQETAPQESVAGESTIIGSNNTTAEGLVPESNNIIADDTIPDSTASDGPSPESDNTLVENKSAVAEDNIPAPNNNIDFAPSSIS